MNLWHKYYDGGNFMRVSKKSSKRVLSFIMALAVALTMCIGFMPQKVLADDPGATIHIYSDGSITISHDATKTEIAEAYLFGSADPSASDIAKNVTYSGNTITINSASFSFFRIVAAGITLVVNGNCTMADYMVYLDTPKLTIQMTKGSSLKVMSIAVDNGTSWDSKSLSDAQSANIIEIKGGKLSADGITIEAGNDATDPTSGAGSNTGETTGTDIKVGDTVTPKDGSSKDSATYKVTGTEEGKRSVTYEKPAENASGTEEVKATVTLKDGNEYKVTAIGDGAFKNFEKKDDIERIIIGDNVEEIGKNACEGLKNVKEVKIGKNVKKIGAKAFKGCVALTKCDVPDNVEEIGESANEGCKKLTKLTIGKKVKKIGKKAYYQSGLKNIKVKSSKLTKASKIGKNAFGKINKKAKVKMKMTKSEARKAKAPTIKVFKNKKIGYVKTWKVS